MDAEQQGQRSNSTTISHNNSSRLSTSGPWDEPQRKRRCVRFPSDLSVEEEDPLLVSDSGFGDLPSIPQENGDSSASSSSPFPNVNTYSEETNAGDSSSNPTVGISQKFNQTHSSNNHPVTFGSSSSSGVVGAGSSSSSLIVEDEDKHPEGNNSNSSVSDPCCSDSRSSSSNSNNDTDSSSVDDSFIDLVLNTKEVSGNPARAAMIQRFLSHLRSNPNDAQLQHFLALLLSGPEFSPPRHRLRHVTTIHDAARLLRCSKKILVLTGAGISVSCGIPDFRSKDGLYSRVAKVFPELRDPQSVFDVRLFRRDPRPFFLTAKELYPGQFEPSLSHKFIRKLETRGQLLRNYSQNIDTLENIAGIDRVTMCHGSFATATCIRCHHKVSAEAIKGKVLAGEVPFCTLCSNEEETKAIQFPLGEPRPEPPSRRGTFDEDDEDDEMYQVQETFPLPPVVKPDIVFFGEDLPDEFHNNLQKDKPDCDLVLVIGSSLRVRPVSLIPGMVPPEVPQILINRESLPHCRFDVELLGNCDSIIAQLSNMMGADFGDLAQVPELREIDKLPKGGVSELDCPTAEISEPKSEHDIQALKACWEPKTNEKLVDRLPRSAYLSWRPRQYIFEGAEEIYDPDEDEDDDDSSDSSSNCSSLPLDESAEKEIEEDLKLGVNNELGESSSTIVNQPQEKKIEKDGSTV